MSRLTKHGIYPKESVRFIDSENNYIPLVPCEMKAHHTQLVLEKLADYEDKQEQGLLIELKVPLGTKIWYLSYEEDYEQGWWDIDCGIYSLSWIHYHENKEFYLTRSEAEEALAKMGE